MKRGGFRSVGVLLGWAEPPDRPVERVQARDPQVGRLRGTDVQHIALFRKLQPLTEVDDRLISARSIGPTCDVDQGGSWFG